MTRKELYEIIEIDGGTNVWSHLYDVGMFIIIILSVVPLMFWDHHPYFTYLEAFTTTIFIIDYILRWITADFRLKKGKHSFVSYPYSFWAIIDMLSILPSFHILGNSFKILRTIRMLKTLRLLKALRYSEQVFIFMDVLAKERKVLSSVLLFAATYIFISALVMFNFEPRINPYTGEVTFRSFLDAIYWSTVTLTTVGYGDLCPVTDLGRIISMLSALFGIAVIALPSGIITASYLDELHKIERKREKEKEKREREKLKAESEEAEAIEAEKRRYKKREGDRGRKTKNDRNEKVKEIGGEKRRYKKEEDRGRKKETGEDKRQM